MKYDYITFRSVTFAQRGERVLRRSGVNCTLSRTPRWMEEQGCGYCLRLGPGAGAGAVALLRAGAVPFSKVYETKEGGGIQPLQL